MCNFSRIISDISTFYFVDYIQYDATQNEIDDESQPQGMIAHQRMQDEKQSEEGSGSDGSRTEHRLRLGDAHEDAIEDKGRHSS